MTSGGKWWRASEMALPGTVRLAARSCDNVCQTVPVNHALWARTVEALAADLISPDLGSLDRNRDCHKGQGGSDHAPVSCHHTGLGQDCCVEHGTAWTLDRADGRKRANTGEVPVQGLS